MAPPRQTTSGDGDRPSLPGFRAFAIRLFLYLFLVSLLFSLGGLHLHLGPLQRLMASAVTAGANLMGAGATGSGPVIRLATTALEINHECTGIFVLLVYASFVAAYPARWLQRAGGILTGVAVLMGVNVARLIALTVIASRYPGSFAYFHEYFFQGLFIALLAFLASIWTEQVRRAALSRVSG
jgi:archaeosortase B (VPXXXP-CTERM-specific)